MKKHSTALAIRERKMKITMKCHLTCIRMATTQKRRERKRGSERLNSDNYNEDQNHENQDRRRRASYLTFEGPFC